MKKKKDNIKERKKITEIIITESAVISSINPNTDGTFTILDSNQEEVNHIQYDSVGYMSESGKPKILRSLPRNSSDKVGDNPWRKYDKIGFVDTNSSSRLENGYRLYVSSFSLLIWEDDKRRFGNIYSANLLVGYCRDGINPERIGWADSIKRLQKSNIINPGDKVLLVVDSEKSEIASINNLEIAVYDDFMLPSQFTLAYATSNSGAESWINKEFRNRDKVANRAMLNIDTDPVFKEIVRDRKELYIDNIFENISK